MAVDNEAYLRSGYALLGAILHSAEVAVLRAEEERLRLPIGFGGDSNQTLRVITHCCDRSEPVRAFATGGAHLDAVRSLMGEDVCLTHQQFITKMPDDGDTTSDIPFHQDSGYGELEPATDVTVWVALDDCTEDNGCLWIVPASHHAGTFAHRRSASNPALRDAGVDTSSAVALPLRAGEAVAFTGQTVHGSGPNRTDRERVAMYVRYCEPSTVMVSEGGRSVLDDPNSWTVSGRAP